MESFSVLPREEAIFVVGAFTLLNPDGLSESPVHGFRKEKLQNFFSKTASVYKKSLES